MKNAYLAAIATMVGTVIGAGILGVPYVVAQAGFWTGIANIVFLGIVAMFLYLYLGEVALRTKGKHQLTGYAEKYLGKTGKILMMFSMIAGVYGALIAYIIGEGQVLAAIFGLDNSVAVSFLGFSLTYNLLFSLIFFAIGTMIIYGGLKDVAKTEMYMLPLILIVVGVVAVLSFGHMDVANFSAFDLGKIFMPYGVVLFAFLGATAIPEMEMELDRKEKLMKKAIIWGMMIPMIVYLLFAVFVVGVTGAGTTGVATIGLGEIVGQHMVLIGNIFSVITMATSFLALGLALRQMYNFDYGLNKHIAMLLTCGAPLIVALLGITSFINALEISGILAGGLTGILIVLMAIKAKTLGDRKPEYQMPINWMIASLFIALFAGGALYYLWTII